jgi:hypothetical protein
MKLRVLGLALSLALPLGLGLSPTAPLEGVRPTQASVSLLISLDDLVAASSTVVVATAGEKTSVWEDWPSGRRIVTYTKLTVERAVVGSPGAEVWVRTLGGAVGTIGQVVSGEAQIAPGSRSLLFLAKAKADNAMMVTAMAQGHFPVLAADAVKGSPPRLTSSPDAGTLLPRRGPTLSARERLVGVTLDEAFAAVKQVRRGADEKK